MTNYYVIWTYIANYGTMWIPAKSAEEAAHKLISGFSKDFQEKGTIYVMDREPAYIHNKPAKGYSM